MKLTNDVLSLKVHRYHKSPVVVLSKVWARIGNVKRKHGEHTADFCGAKIVLVKFRRN